MPIVGHLIRHTPADHLHLDDPRLLLAAFVLGILIVAVDRNAHHDLHDLGAALGGVLSPVSVWGQYRLHLLLERRPPVTAATLATWRRILFDFWDYLEHARGKPWHKAGKQDLKAFLARPCQSGRRKGLPIQDATASAKTVCITQFYRTAAIQDWVGTDRMLGVRPPRVRNAAPRALRPDVLRQVLLAAEHDPRLYLIVWLCYGDCLRIGEVASLRTEDIWWDDPQPRMRVDGKGGKERWIHLHPEVRAALSRYLAGPPPLPSTGPLIRSLRWPARGVHPNTLSKELSGFIGGIAGQGSAHWLRHTGAQAALASKRGRNLEDVRQLLGHESDRTTRRYLLGYNWDVVSAVEGIPDPRRPAPT